MWDPCFPRRRSSSTSTAPSSTAGGDIVAALNHALLATKRQPLPAIAIVGLIGDGARALVARAAQIPENKTTVTENGVMCDRCFIER